MWLRDAFLCATLSFTLGSAQAFDLQGHRGARGLAPENTLPAFARALGIGVTTLELDIGITRDDVPVIAHDPYLNPNLTRGPDGKWLEDKGPLIRTLTYEELRRYDVGRMRPGTRYADGFPEQVAVDGTRIPKLADLFDLVRRSGNSSVQFDIETKLSPLAPDATAAPEVFAELLLAEIRRAGLVDRVQIQSFDWRTLQAVQKLEPRIPTAYLTAEQSWLDNVGAGSASGSRWVAGFQYAAHGSVPKMIKAAGGSIWSAYFRDMHAARLAEARALGLKVLVWTVNRPADIEEMLALGVDGIITDYPDRVREAMKARGMPLPAPSPVKP